MKQKLQHKYKDNAIKNRVLAENNTEQVYTPNYNVYVIVVERIT